MSGVTISKRVKLTRKGRMLPTALTRDIISQCRAEFSRQREWKKLPCSLDEDGMPRFCSGPLVYGPEAA